MFHGKIFPRAVEESRRRRFGRELAAGTGGGSSELLSELIEIFFVDKEKMMADLRDGLSRSDPVAVSCVAHMLKGALGTLGAEAASRAVLRLENIGRGGELGQAEEAHSVLEREMERFEPELAAVAEKERQRTEAPATAGLCCAVKGGAGS